MTSILQEMLRNAIPYKIMLMQSIFEDVSFINTNPDMVGTYFARQAIALVKIRDLYGLLLKPAQQYKNCGLLPLRVENIDPHDQALLGKLCKATSKTEAHTTPDNHGFSYEDGTLLQGVQIICKLLDEHWYIPNGLKLDRVLIEHRFMQSQKFVRKQVKQIEVVEA